MLSRIRLPRLDQRQFGYFVLPNGLQIMHVYDNNTEKSAACLRVNVGHKSDPMDIPGMAHYTEHMLFLGTKEYPNESEYKKFISLHGGSSNAATGMDYTKYYFDIQSTEFDMALHRFSRFFVSPLFLRDCSAREVKAIENEHQRNVPNDSRRWWYVLKRTSNPLHGFHKFGTGNAATLVGPDLRDRMVRWYRDHYLSQRMTLCLVTPPPKGDQMTTSLTPYFNDIGHSNHHCDVEDDRNTPMVFSMQSLGTVLWYKPLDKRRVLKLLIPSPFPSDGVDSNAKTLRLLNNLLSHEGVGSICHYLKRVKFFILSLSCSEFSVGRKEHDTIIEVAMELTELGENNISSVLAAYTKYVKMLQSADMSVIYRFYDELHRTYETMFAWSTTSDAVSTATFIADKLSETHNSNCIENILYSSYRMDGIHEDRFHRLLHAVSQITRCRIGMWSQTLTNNQSLVVEKDPYYGAEYAVTEIPAEWLRDLIEMKSVQDFDPALPSPNPYVPTPPPQTIQQCPTPPPPPPATELTPINNITRIQDKTFGTPKRVCRLSFIHPMCYEVPRTAVLNVMMSRLLTTAIDRYDSKLAGMSYRFISCRNGLDIETSGFSEKMPMLLTDLVQSASNVQFSKSDFEVLLAEIREDYENDLKNASSHSRAMDLVNQSLYRSVFQTAELLPTVETITLQDVSQHRDRSLLDIGGIDGLFYGDIEPSESGGSNVFPDWMGASTASRFNVHNHLERFRSLQIRRNEGSVILNTENATEDPNRAMVMYISSGLLPSPENVVLARVLQKIVHPKYFSSLRTAQQLGYVVHFRYRIDHNILGFEFVVQSSTHTTEHLVNQTIRFLQEHECLLASNLLNEDIVRTALKGVEKELRDPVRNVYDAASIAWTETQRCTR
eukprot:PhF_6_TR37545/c0_g2_i1/m.55611/K01408/IDE, ide; insulysin